jgi:hypothetical protein
MVFCSFDLIYVEDLRSKIILVLVKDFEKIERRIINRPTLNKLQMLFLVILNLKMLSTYMENTLYKLLLDQNQNSLKSLFYTLERFE